jgi:hypothetical protein
MDSSKEVVPWKCYICQSEFDFPSGGICSRCNQATCRKHLHQIGQITKLDAKWVCGSCLTDEEKTAKKVQRRSVLRLIVLAVILLLAFGFVVDLFSGLYILRQAKSVYAGLAGLLIVAIFFLAGEAGSEWIGGKDKVTDPLYKRALRLLGLLFFGAFVISALLLVLKQFGIIGL